MLVVKTVLSLARKGLASLPTKSDFFKDPPSLIPPSSTTLPPPPRPLAFDAAKLLNIEIVGMIIMGEFSNFPELQRHEYPVNVCVVSEFVL